MTRTVFLNARVFDGETMGRDRMTVVVEDDRIARLSPVPVEDREGDRRIDLNGRTVMPGMTTGHWHPDYDKLTLQELVGVPLGMTKPPAYLIAMAYRNLDAVLNSGVTRVLGAGCAFDIDASFKMAINDGKFPGPRIMCGSRHINTTGNFNDNAHWWYDMGGAKNGLSFGPADIFCDGPAEFAKATRMEIRRGAQIIKVFTSGGHGVMSPNERRDVTPVELAAVVEAAHDRGALVRSHCVGRAAVLATAKAGVDIIDHADEVDEECIETMAKHGCAWVPSMLLPRRLIDMGVLPPAVAASYQADFENVARMLPLADKAGVRVVPGDDYGIVATPHVAGIYSEELAVYARDMSLPAEMLLRWATVNGAAIMGDPAQGMIKEGSLADLVVVEGDPVADIALLANPKNISGVMVGGKFVVDRLG